MHKLMIGTVQFGMDYGIANQCGKPSDYESCEIIRTALNYGIDWVDTARTYGSSEKVLGNIAKKLNAKLNIVTKTLTHGKPEEIIDTLKKSLSDLNVDSVHGFLVHHANSLIDDKSDIVFGHMNDAKDAGLVKKIGVTVYNTEQTFAILEKYPIDIIQIPCNVLEQRFVRSGAIRKLAEKKVEIHIRSIFLQGLLLMDIDTVPNYFNSIIPHLSNLQVVAKTNGISMLELSIVFVKSLSCVDRMIVGVQNVEQLHSIVHAYSKHLEHIIDFSQFSIDNEQFIDPSKWDY